MDIRVNKALSYHPRGTWGARTVGIDGELSDGRRVHLSSLDDAECVSGEIRSRATHEWLHGHVLVIAGDDATPRVVLPTPTMNDAVVGEALRRWLTTAA